MGRRAFVVATLLMAALIFAAPSAGAGVNILLLRDTFSIGDGTAALIAAFQAAGHSVTVGPIEYTWNGSNPPISGFDVVVHLNGKTWDSPLPVAGQQALVDFVSSGGGYVGGQWNALEAHAALLVTMDDLVLHQGWPGLDNCEESQMTWSIVQGEEGHPVLAGIPDSFTFYADGHDAAPTVDFSVFPSVVLMISPTGGPAVTVREFENGRVVAFSIAANYRTEDTLQDTFIQDLYVNAVSWAASAPATIEGLKARVAALEDSGALNKGRANALMSKLDAAARQIDRGHLNAAESQMWAFVNQVEAWIRSGVLTEEDGDPLLVIANQIIADLAG